MHDSIFYYIDNQIKCASSFRGSYAAYLVKNGKVVEKKHYSKAKEKLFSWHGEGVYAVRFFFAEKGERVKYLTPSFFISEQTVFLADGVKVPFKNIAEGENFRISIFDNKSDVTFITFNGTQSRKKSLPFAFRYCVKREYNLVSVNQDGDSQYQDLSLDAFKEAVSPYLTSSNFCYGASLGGYCAIYYGGVIDANIISVSPKNSAHPKFLKKRLRGLVFKHDEIHKGSKSSRDVDIFYDPYKVEDVKFLETLILPYSDKCYLHPLPHAGHRLLEYVKELGCLTQLIDSLVEGECIDVEKDVENSTYLAEKAWYYFVNGSPVKSREFAEKSLKKKNNVKAKKIIESLLEEVSG